jgi:hypothetical protein
MRIPVAAKAAQFGSSQAKIKALSGSNITRHNTRKKRPDSLPAGLQGWEANFTRSWEE